MFYGTFIHLIPLSHTTAINHSDISFIYYLENFNNFLFIDIYVNDLQSYIYSMIALIIDLDMEKSMKDHKRKETSKTVVLTRHLYFCRMFLFIISMKIFSILSQVFFCVVFYVVLVTGQHFIVVLLLYIDDRRISQIWIIFIIVIESRTHFFF